MNNIRINICGLYYQQCTSYKLRGTTNDKTQASIVHKHRQLPRVIIVVWRLKHHEPQWVSLGLLGQVRSTYHKVIGAFSRPRTLQAWSLSMMVRCMIEKLKTYKAKSRKRRNRRKIRQSRTMHISIEPSKRLLQGCLLFNHEFLLLKQGLLHFHGLLLLK